MFRSHVEDYQIVQKFRVEEDEKYSTKISKSGTGLGILIRKDIRHNLLEWACYSDLIMTVIIFKKDLNIWRQNQDRRISGTILISVYREHKIPLKTIYDELRNIIQKIHQRYKDPTIIIGGDFNDKSPPKEL